MLQQIREHAQGWLAWIILGIIAATFVFWGVGSYFTGGGNQDLAAKVNGKGITLRQLDDQVERLRAQARGRQVDENALRSQALETLISNEVLNASLLDQGFRISDEQVNNVILSVPAFQENGRFSQTLFEKQLNRAHYTEGGLRDSLKDDLLTGQIQSAFQDSAISLPYELDLLAQMLEESREIAYVTLPIKSFQKAAIVEIDSIKKYYDSHLSEFMTKDLVAIEYVELSLQDLLKTIDVPEEEVKAYYEANTAQYKTPAQVHAAHILISIPKGADEKVAKAAEDKANDIQNQLKKGADFSKLALQYSDDPASAKKGGDIGWFSPGEMEVSFEKAAFDLKKPGDITPMPIRSDYGFHIIKLIDKKEGKDPTYAEVHDLALATVKRQKAEDLMASKEDELSNLTYDHPDTLQVAADKLGLTVEKHQPFDQSGGDSKITTDKNVLKSAFSDNLLKKHLNSEIIELDPENAIVLRVSQHIPAIQQPMEQVKDNIKEILLKEAAEKGAKDAGEALLKQALDGKDLKTLATEGKFDYKKDTVDRDNQELDPTFLKNVYRIPRYLEKVSERTVGFALDNGDYVVASLLSAKDGKYADLSDEKKKQYAEGLKTVNGRMEYQLYVKELVNNASVTRYSIEKQKAVEEDQEE